MSVKFYDALIISIYFFVAILLKSSFQAMGEWDLFGMLVCWQKHGGRIVSNAYTVLIQLSQVFVQLKSEWLYKRFLSI